MIKETIPLQEKVQTFLINGFSACEQLQSQITEYFKKDSETLLDVSYYKKRMIDLQKSARIQSTIKDVMGILGRALVIPTVASFDFFEIHQYERDLAAPSVLFTEFCTDFTVLFVIRDGADIFVSMGQDTQKVPVSLGHCIVMQKPVTFSVRNVKRDGSFILMKIKQEPQY